MKLLEMLKAGMAAKKTKQMPMKTSMKQATMPMEILLNNNKRKVKRQAHKDDPGMKVAKSRVNQAATDMLVKISTNSALLL